MNPIAQVQTKVQHYQQSKWPTFQNPGLLVKKTELIWFQMIVGVVEHTHLEEEHPRNAK